MKQTIQTVVRGRRTIRTFTNENIETDTLLDLLEDAIYAPNHRHREPWSFLLIRDDAKSELLEHVVNSYLRMGVLATVSEEQLEKKKKGLEELFFTCPIHLIVTMDEREERKEWEEDFAATSAMIQNLQLLAWEQGIGMVWKTNPYIYDPTFYTDMKIEGKKIVGVLHIGYAAKIPAPRERTSAREKVEIRGAAEKSLS